MAIDPKLVQDLFLRLAPLPPADRLETLDQECDSDIELRQRVEALLRAHDEPDSYLDRPGVGLGLPLDFQPDPAEPAVTGEHSRDSDGSEGVRSQRTETFDFRRHAIADAVIDGRYTLLQRIGEGGMGEVWVARQSAPVKRKVALKLIKIGMDSKAVLQRFEHERQALALMDHPNISRVLDGGMTSSGQPFFVMELVNGWPLDEFCDREKLTLKQRLELFVPICQAVQHAHQKGIVHRDLKPANILVTMIDGHPVPKVIDFGVAKATSGKLTEESMFTQFGAVVGTLEYMSPEQAGCSGDDIDTRADIYSLGVIMYELLTGLRPIDSARLRKAAFAERIRVVREEEPSKPSARLSTDASAASVAALRQTEPKKLMTLLRGELDWVVMKCLEKQRDRRYDTANALVRDVQRYLADEMVEARPPSAGYRLQKLIKRNKGPVFGASLVVLALVLGMAGATWGLIEARRQEDIARQAQAEEHARADAERLARREAVVARRAAEKAQQAENKARDRAEQAFAMANSEKLKSQRMSAGLAFNRGLRECEGGKVKDGLLWMAESLAINPPEDREFGDLVRRNLASWSTALTIQRRVLSHERAVTGVTYSPDGSTVVSTSGGVVRRWNALTGQQVGKDFVQPGEISRVAFSPDGQFIATGSFDMAIRIWDVAREEMIGQPIPQPSQVGALTFSPDGRWLGVATGYHQDSRVTGTARVLEVASGNPVSPVLSHPDIVRGIAFHWEGKRVITGGGDGLLRTWDIISGELVGEPYRFSAGIRSMATSKDQLMMAVGLQNGDAYVYFIPRNDLISRAHQHSAPVNAVAFHPNQALVLTGCDDGLARVWEWLPGTEIGPPLAHQSYLTSVDFSPDGRSLISGSIDKHARLWDLPLACLQGMPIAESDSNLAEMDLDPSLVSGRPRTRISGSQGRRVPHWIWDFLSASFSPDGRFVVTGSVDNNAYVWDSATGRRVGKPLPHENWVRAVAFAPDNRRVITGSHDMTARIWDSQTGEPLGPILHHESEIISVAISPDGTKAVTGCGGDHSARLWDLDSGQPIGAPMLHRGSVSSVAFSSDGRLILTGASAANGVGGEARLWDATTAKPLSSPARHIQSVTAVRFHKDAKSFLTNSSDGVARRWPIPEIVPGDADHVRLWAQVATGKELVDGQSVVVLEPAAWEERRTQVMHSELRSLLSTGPDAIEAWHELTAAANEPTLVGEAVHWHLDHLQQIRHKDWLLHTRRGAVLHRYARDAEALIELERAAELGGFARVRDWCVERADNLERMHQHQSALWFRQWIATSAPQEPEANSALGHCLARLRQFEKAREHFTKAVALAPDRIDFQHDLAMAQLAISDLTGYRKTCSRLVEVAATSDSPEDAYLIALTCVFDPDTLPNWDPVVRLAASAAEGYDGDRRLHVAALFRASQVDDALRYPFTMPTRYSHVVWEWLFQGMLRLRAGRHDEARSILEQVFRIIDLMDKEFPRDPNSNIWSEWIYHVQCHTLRAEAQALLDDGGQDSSPSNP